MDEIKFKVRFITPLLIHGAYPKVADDIGLTGKALRGAWRFWFRAMAGGMKLSPSISADRLAELEGEIFGSADEKVGATFKLRITPCQSIQPVSNVFPGFYKGFNFSGYLENCSFQIGVLPRSQLANGAKNVLFATVWLWANLGAVGQRSRRGFGSPVLKKMENEATSFVEGVELPETPEFEGVNTLSEHLQAGFDTVFSVFSDWLNSKGFASATGSSIPDYFVLTGPDHITVGGSTYSTREEAIIAVHGQDRCRGLGYAGKNERMASPVLMRLHKIGDQFIPVAVWSGKTLPCGMHVNSDCVAMYLKRCHCNSWLNGGAIT